MLKRHFIYVRIVLLTKDILFVCITLRTTLRRIFIALYFICLYVLYMLLQLGGVANKLLYYYITPHRTQEKGRGAKYIS